MYPSQQSGADLSGGWVGGYNLLRRIGTGGSGTVWEATDDGGTRVALKMLHPSLADTDAARRRLLREARLVNQIRSPGVARVLDVEADALTPFVVTDLVEGPTLHHVVAKEPLSPEETYDLAVSLAEVLDAVHAAGIAHRDLKPSNVIMSPDGPVLIDFGIAQGVDDRRLTQTGLITGTPGFVAPEILRASEGLTVENWQDGDWFAWTALMLQAATGRPPFGSGSVEVLLHRVFRGEADTAGLPPRVARAFRLTLNPEPLMRTSPDDLLTALEEWDAGNIEDTGTSDLSTAFAETATGETATQPLLDSLPHTALQGLSPGPMVGQVPQLPVPDHVPLQLRYAPYEHQIPQPEYVHPYPVPTPLLSILLLGVLAWIPAFTGAVWMPAIAGVLLLLQLMGRTEERVVARRLLQGAKRRSDDAVALIVLPWNLVVALVHLLPGLVVGALTFTGVLAVSEIVSSSFTGQSLDFSVLWPWLRGAENYPSPPTWQLGIATWAGLLVAWITPTSGWARTGMYRVFTTLAPTPVLRWVWRLLLGATCVVFALFAVG